MSYWVAYIVAKLMVDGRAVLEGEDGRWRVVDWGWHGANCMSECAAPHPGGSATSDRGHFSQGGEGMGSLKI